jgi:site-specific DNA-adenine methylase
VIYVSTNRTRSSYAVTFSGMTLDELAALLKSHNVKAEVYYASETTLNQFRPQAKANLTRSGDYIIVNYQRSILSQGKSGHISPLLPTTKQAIDF